MPTLFSTLYNSFFYRLVNRHKIPPHWSFEDLCEAKPNLECSKNRPKYYTMLYHHPLPPPPPPPPKRIIVRVKRSTLCSQSEVSHTSLQHSIFSTSRSVTLERPFTVRSTFSYFNVKFMIYVVVFVFSEF